MGPGSTCVTAKIGINAPRRGTVCEVCGKLAAGPICPACADKIRAEAVARKRREDKGME